MLDQLIPRIEAIAFQFPDFLLAQIRYRRAEDHFLFFGELAAQLFRGRDVAALGGVTFIVGFEGLGDPFVALGGLFNLVLGVSVEMSVC